MGIYYSILLITIRSSNNAKFIYSLLYRKTKHSINHFQERNGISLILVS